MNVISHDFLDANRWHGKVYGAGWLLPKGGMREVIEPATGTVLATVGFGNAEDITQAARLAAAAQPGWAAVSPRDKAAIFRKAADHLQAHFDDLALMIARETGGIIPKAQHEVREAVFLFQLAAGLAVQSPGVLLPTTPGRQSYARRVPHGVVGVISPFNFPLILSLRSVAPALAVGNAVVLKPDPQTPISGGFIIARALEEAGLPPNVLHVVPGAAEAGEALCSDPHVGMVAFTGSTAAGRKVGEACGRNLKKVSLELGGKSSLIVLEDADPEIAASNIAWGTWLHQGQICMSSGRILLHEKIAPAVIEILKAKATHLPVGDPASGQVALGPLINARQRDRVHAIVTETVAAGATLEAGGSHDGLFYKPTVLSGVKPGMRAFEEEVFGPVVNITTFATDAEAVALANRTEYGLSGAVISPDVGRAMALGEQLKTGLLHINDQTVNDECLNPFGGRGCSGNGGRVGGPADADEYTQWQWVTVKNEAPRYPF
ncbi:benzaldehyde dehydrogenase [Oryzibacter oryziterrae]|uniref:benzaldehyde dehydrogenase n=1 Tax=Oryzibacter oryziterrae TaxID=2766474 RepID=UPI001F47D9DD|nr:benzaldehyde dehydrogenase [Oryzibacter oryziterrae]